MFKLIFLLQSIMIFLLGTQQLCFGFSYVVSVETGISFYEMDAEAMVEENSEIYRIRNDISFSFSVNNGILFFRRWLLDTSFNYTKRPDIEYGENTLLDEFVHLSFLLGLKYYLNSYAAKNNIAFALYLGNNTEEVITKSYQGAVLQTPTIARNNSVIFVPELGYFLRTNPSTFIYGELRVPLFLFDNEPYFYWQVLLGVEMEIDFQRKFNLIKEKKQLKKRDLGLTVTNSNQINTNEQSFLMTNMQTNNIENTNR